MKPEEIAKTLRPHRAALVKAAEGVMDAQYKKGPLNKPPKTQFSNLVGLCNEASCSEEIDNYIRYQVGRREWDKDFAQSVLGAIKKCLDHKDFSDAPLSDGDILRVQAWRLYATYLTRAYVYQSAVQRPGGQR